MTKYERIADIVRKVDAIADAKGAFRAGLIWDVTVSLKALEETLKSEEERRGEGVGNAAD